MRLSIRVSAAAIALAPLASPLGAQRKTTLVVTVGEAGTGAFLSDTQVRLPGVGRIARTDRQGEAQFAALEAGRIDIEVRRVGYAPSSVARLISGDTASAVFFLERMAATLDTVHVNATHLTPAIQEYETRRPWELDDSSPTRRSPPAVRGV